MSSKTNNPICKDERCGYCKHYPNEHSRNGKGRCQGTDVWGKCHCPRWMTEQESELMG